MLSPYLFSLYAKYNMRNARLDEAQASIKIAGLEKKKKKKMPGEISTTSDMQMIPL